jgi:hypothetical protein
LAKQGKMAGNGAKALPIPRQNAGGLPTSTNIANCDEASMYDRIDLSARRLAGDGKIFRWKES